MFGRVRQFCSQLFYSLLYKIGWVSIEQTNMLRIYVKTSGNTIPVDIDPSWDIRYVKNILAPKLGMSPSEFKIILAGKELHQATVIERCDLGQYSVLHAARVAVKRDVGESFDETVEQGSEPLCETIMDLQLTEEEIRMIESEQNTKPKAQFYVYCNTPCKALKKGKLRVLCQKCGNGAFTVSRDPHCWEDVLEPKKIKGTCSTEDCTGTFAEFYFKCSEHFSQGENDRSVALHMIKSNFKEVPCLACADVSDPILVFECEPSHVICLDCFRTYCTSRLNDRQFTQDERHGYTLPCPAGCPDSLIKESHHFKLLGNDLYAKYQKFGTEECLLQAGGVLCPQPDCGMGLLPDPTCRRIQCENGCGYVFCRNCLQGYHIGDCEEPPQLSATGSTSSYTVDATRVSQATWEEASKVTIKLSTKPCPKCRIPTERDGGCMHMVCTRSQCGFHWCWMCQTEWSRECMGNHWFG